MSKGPNHDARAVRGFPAYVSGGSGGRGNLRALGLLALLFLLLLWQWSSSNSSNNGGELLEWMTPDSAANLKANAPFTGKLHLQSGLKTISELHKQEILHRAVRIHVLDADGRILLLKRTQKLVTCPGAWTLVGEHRKPGETVLEACQRGIYEELGAPHTMSPQSLGVTTIPQSFYMQISKGSNQCAGFGARRGESQIFDSCVVQFRDQWSIVTDNEVEESRWLSLQEFQHEILSSPENFCCPELASTFQWSSTLLQNWAVR